MDVTETTTVEHEGVTLSQTGGASGTSQVFLALGDRAVTVALSEYGRDVLTALLEPYFDAGNPVEAPTSEPKSEPKQKRSRKSRTSHSSSDPDRGGFAIYHEYGTTQREVRTWLKEHGYDVNPSGNIKHELVWIYLREVKGVTV